MKFPLFPEQASNLAPSVDALYFFLVGISALVMVVIFVPMFYFLAKYRQGTNADRRPARISALKVEIMWMVIPLILVLIMFYWGAVVFANIQRPPPSGTLDIHIIGKQWMWKAQHPNGSREINELHVPVGEMVKLTMTSQDVIHSFFLPAFRLKQDVLPGRYTTMWFVPTKIGVYHLFCAEYCGTKHSQMVGRIYVMSQPDYERWLTIGGSQEPLTTTGGRLFRNLGCSGCHAPNSVVRAPPLEGLYGKPVPLQNGRIVQADEQYIRDSILLPQSQIAAGYDPVMPTFEGYLTEEQVFQLVAYIKSLAPLTPSAQTP